ncbi:MAG: MFS transporter [Phycisphaerales bacterium]|jgi:nucleoside transporter|nr:MFS transporter [Phycisphaerales bacterium]
MTQHSKNNPTFLLPRLSVMMFLQFAIWGAWLPLLWNYLDGHLGFEGARIGEIFMVGGIGAILGPFIAGQIADRYFNTEKFLGICHILGGILIWQLSWINTYGMFLLFSLLYSMIYAPTLALTNSLSFHHLSNRDKDFGKIRLWGTVGWIAVGIGIGQYLLHAVTPAIDPALTGVALEEAKTGVIAAQNAGIVMAFKLSAVLGLVMGIYCFTLPSTPPTKSEKSNATAKALGEISMQPLITLFLIAVPVSCVHQFYFVHTAPFVQQVQAGLGSEVGISAWINSIFGVGGGGLMTLGQMSEILVLALMPILALKFSRKALLTVGLIAYVLRFFLFANVGTVLGAATDTQVGMVIGGILLHGLCFGCFIFVAFMVVDEEMTPDVKASGQNLFNLVIVGIGIIVGSLIAGWVAGWATVDGEMQFDKLFSVPMWGALACLLLMMFLYPSKSKEALSTAS